MAMSGKLFLAKDPSQLILNSGTLDHLRINDLERRVLVFLLRFHNHSRVAIPSIWADRPFPHTLS